MTVSDTWDLESIFAGGSRSAPFRDFVAALERDVAAVGKRVRDLGGAAPDAELRAVLLDAQAAEQRLDEAISFAECLRAQDTADADAGQWIGRLDTVAASLKALGAALAACTAGLPDERWQALTGGPELRPIAFLLDQRRDLARRKMEAAIEGLVEELATDGYHAWDRQYTTLAGSLRAEVEVGGERRRLSMGQLAARLEEPARADRKAAFEALEAAWRPVAELAAGALNGQAGFRLTWYRHRGWDSVLDEPLHLNRMEARSLEAMWAAVAESAPRLIPYLQAKANLIGVDALRWYDLQAPVGAEEGALSFDAAAQRILDCFDAHDPDLRAFSERAFDGRWIEAADREGKAAGGFCTTLPIRRETRIFMTYGGTFGGATTLAHELGHAYHAWLLRDRPYHATSYPMTLAETASTFCEGLLISAALDQTADAGVRLRLLDRVLEEALTMLMNLRSRFLFEIDFYRRRAAGPLTAAELDELMVDAQRRAYCGALAADGWHPLFWASKLHFYFTDVPFYNFPYVVGYLLASGLAARAAAEGPGFAADYRRLLADTGVMTCEDLARRHLGVDLGQPEFWQAAIDRPLSHVGEFARLAGNEGSP